MHTGYDSSHYVLTQAARDDIVLVGDLMKSITVLRFDSDSSQFIEYAARSFNPPESFHFSSPSVSARTQSPSQPPLDTFYAMQVGPRPEFELDDCYFHS